MRKIDTKLLNQVERIARRELDELLKDKRIKREAALGRDVAGQGVVLVGKKKYTMKLTLTITDK